VASPQAQAVLESMRLARTRPEQPIEEQRAAFDLLGVSLPLAEGVEVRRVDVAGVPGEWLVADADGPVVVHLHGGGFVIGSCSSHRPFASRLAAALGGRVLVPDYRRAPEHPFPAAVDDAAAALWHAVRAAGGRGVAVTGDSAGGALALMLLGRRPGDDGTGGPSPTCLGLVSPLTDLTLSGDSMATKAEADPVLSPELLASWVGLFADGVPLDDPRLAPLAVDLAGAPPLLVMVGSEEVLLDDARRLARRAEAAGVDVTIEEWSGLFHIWTVFAPLLPEADQGIARLADFVRAHAG
jgi:monoterpene epsilon-lactone hydrolase